MTRVLSQKEILSLFTGQGIKSITLTVLAEMLGTGKAGKPELRRILGKLVSRGKIFKDRKGRYSLPEAGTRMTRKKDASGELVRGKVVSSRGRFFLQPVDNPRKSARRVYIPIKEISGARPGELVSATVVTKGRKKPAYAIVSATLKGAASFSSVTREFYKANGISFKYTKKLTKETRNRCMGLMSKASGRVDLRDQYVLAVDPEGAKDHDDAVALEKNGSGWILHVHIADVAEYVTPDLSLNKEAIQKSFTTYLPWTAFPMLPSELSSDLCSLVRNKDKLCLTCRISVAEDGTIQDYEFFESMVRVKSFKTYEEACKAEQEGDVYLKNLAEFTRVVLNARRKSGVLDFDLPDAKVQLDDAGEPCSMKPVERLESHSWIEECMLLANRCAAQFLNAHKLPGIHRVHESPDSSDVMEIARLEQTLFHSQEIMRIIKNRSSTKRAADLDLRQLYVKLLSLREKEGMFIPVFIQRKILRTMKKAMYSPDNLGHFALGFRNYAHFTSPIRRFPDLWNHRLIKNMLNGRRIPGYMRKEAVRISDLASEREQEIMKLERKALKLSMAWILRDQVGQTFSGYISGFSESGMWVFVETEQVYGEGWISLACLADDFYEYREKEERMVGRRSRSFFALGDKVRIQLDKVNPVNGFVDFSVIAKMA